MQRLIFCTAVGAAVLAGFWFKTAKPRAAQALVQVIPENAKRADSLTRAVVDAGPREPIARALYLRGKMMQSSRETSQMLALLSDEKLIELARVEWLAGQMVTRDTGFLRRALEWRDNPKHAEVVRAIQQILTLPSISTVEQQARQAELLVSLIQTAPDDFQRIKPQIGADLMFEAKRYFHHYSRS